MSATFFETTNGLVVAGAVAFDLPAEPETVALPDAEGADAPDEPDEEEEPEAERPEVIEGAKPTAGLPPCE